MEFNTQMKYDKFLNSVLTQPTINEEYSKGFASRNDESLHIKSYSQSSKQEKVNINRNESTNKVDRIISDFLNKVKTRNFRPLSQKTPITKNEYNEDFPRCSHLDKLEYVRKSPIYYSQPSKRPRLEKSQQSIKSLFKNISQNEDNESANIFTGQDYNENNIEENFNSSLYTENNYFNSFLPKHQFSQNKVPVINKTPKILSRFNTTTNKNHEEFNENKSCKFHSPFFKEIQNSYMLPCKKNEHTSNDMCYISPIQLDSSIHIFPPQHEISRRYVGAPRAYSTPIFQSAVTQSQNIHNHHENHRNVTRNASTQTDCRHCCSLCDSYYNTSDFLVGLKSLKQPHHQSYIHSHLQPSTSSFQPILPQMDKRFKSYYCLSEE